jgi:hypothetical protein
MVVILMDGDDGGGNINDSSAAGACVPNEPVVEPWPAGSKGGQLSFEEAAAEAEIVYKISGALPLGRKRAPSNAIFPVSVSEIEPIGDVRVPTSTHDQKFAAPVGHAFECLWEVRGQNNVAIDVAKQLVLGEILCPVEDPIQVGRVELVTWNRRLQMSAKLASDFRGSPIVTENKDFDSGVQAFPALDGIALDDGAVASKRFRCSKNREHVSFACA